MSELTFLTEEQWFSDEQLEIFEKRGAGAAITDFSILLGADFSDHIHIKNNDSLEGRIGHYWSKSDDGYHKLNGDNTVKVLCDNWYYRSRWR